MYIFLSVLAACAWALSGTLMAGFYRKLDVVSASSYRGLALACVMLPMLLFVPIQDFATIPQYLPPIFYGSILVAIGNIVGAYSIRHLPIGIASALSTSFRTMTALAMAVYMLGEVLTGFQFALVGALMVCVILLSLSNKKSDFEGVNASAYFAGVAMTLLVGVVIGWSMTMIAAETKGMNSILLTVVWENTITAILLSAAVYRGLCTGNYFAKIDRQSFFKIALFSSPTIIGTMAFSVAVKLGFIGIVSAILSVGSVVSAILAFLLYKEKLTRLQVSFIALCCVAIAGLNLAG